MKADPRVTHRIDAGAGEGEALVAAAHCYQCALKPFTGTVAYSTVQSQSQQHVIKHEFGKLLLYK